jgi:CHAT domain-containing protein/Flp pilus assembly protein TadD
MVMVTATAFLRKSCSVLILVGCCACGPEAGRYPAVVYERAESLRRAGNMPKALEEAQRGYQAWRDRPEETWHWKFRLLTAETLISQSKSQEALPLLQGVPPATVPGRDELEARRELSQAVIAYYQSKYVPGLDLLDRARSLAEKFSAWGLAAQCFMQRIRFDLRLNRPDAAETDARAATVAAERTSDRYVRANALGSLGYFLLNRYRYDEAIRWLELSIDASRPGDYQAVMAIAYMDLGYCYYRLGDWNQAESYMQKADTSLAKAGLAAREQIAVANIGLLHQSLGDFQGSIPFFQHALQISTRLRDDFWAAKQMNNLAEVYITLGDLDTAERYDNQALAMQKTRNDPEALIYPILNAARIAAGRGKIPEAGKLYQDALDLNTKDPASRWAVYAGRADLAFRGGDVARARTEVAKAVNIIDASWSQLSNDQSKLTFPGRVMRFYSEYVDFLVSQNRGEEALAFAESRRGRLLAEKMGVDPLLSAAKDFRRLAQQEHAVLLSYWLGPERSYLWAAAPNGFRTVTLAGEPKIRTLVDSYTHAIQDPRSSDLAQNPAARELYQTLIAPAADLIPPGSHVIVVPDGCLHNLNLETLVTPANRFWIEDAAVEIAPSLLLLGGGQHNRRTEADSALLIGNAEPSDPDLPPLPYASKEISGIADLYPNHRELTGPKAKPEAYRAADPARYSLIHFAAHAIPNQDSPLDSAVVLSPGKNTAKLYAREIVSIPLQARLVTISACRSAGIRTFSSEGLVGLAWAFLSAGAQNVVASLWDVNDQSAASLMDALYGKLRGGEAPGRALHEVKLDFARAGGTRGKPYYWAAFQLYTR